MPDTIRLAGVNPWSGEPTTLVDQLPASGTRMLAGIIEKGATLEPGRTLASGDVATKISDPLPDGTTFSMREIVEGSVVHLGREAIALRLETAVPPNLPVAFPGYSLIDRRSALPLEGQMRGATVENGIGNATLTTSRQALAADPDPLGKATLEARAVGLKTPAA